MNDNIISLVPTDAKQITPENDYVICTVDGDELYGTGFLVFTSHHIAVMRDIEQGALPVLVVPLDKVKFAEIVENEEAPF